MINTDSIAMSFKSGSQYINYDAVESNTRNRSRSTSSQDSASQVVINSSKSQISLLQRNSPVRQLKRSKNEFYIKHLSSKSKKVKRIPHNIIGEKPPLPPTPASQNSTAEQERIQRRQWAEERYIEEEVPRRLEVYIQQLVTRALLDREDRISKLVEDRVAVERQRIEERSLQLERQLKQRELEAQKRREEEERRLREENLFLQEEMRRLEAEQEQRREEERRRQQEEQLKELQRKQEVEEAEKRRKEAELERILNKKRTRAKISLRLKR